MTAASLSIRPDAVHLPATETIDLTYLIENFTLQT